MASNTAVVKNVTIVSDMSGAEGATERVFHDAVTGRKVRIDLTDAEAAKLTKAVEALSKFTELGRTGTTVTRNEDAPHIRAYARTLGTDVPAKGRLSDDMVAQWEQAGSPRI